MAKNTLAILRRQRALLDRAIWALEECQMLAFAGLPDDKDAVVRQAWGKLLRLCKEPEQEKLDRRSLFPPDNDSGNQ